MNKNPWVPGTIAAQAEKFLSTKDRKARADIQNNLIRQAQELLRDPRFIEYRRLYENYYKICEEDLMMLGEQDPIKYAFKVRQLIDTMKAYRLLITAIEDQASMKIEEEI